MKNNTNLFLDLNKKLLQDSFLLDNQDIEEKKELKKISSTIPYLAMFPIDIPWFLIKRFSNENDIVMDNFSGRGTTAITARYLKRKFVGNDLNPMAYVSSRYKVSKISYDSFINRVDLLEKEFNLKNKECIDPEDEMLIYYSKYTLEQLYFLRNKIGKSWLNNDDIDNAILAISIGIMHGKQKKNGDSSYFSISMSNTISMSINYVKNYAIKHNLKRPEINIFTKIKERFKFKYSTLFKNDYDAVFKYHNSLKPFEFIDDNSVSLVVTSPPYLSIVNYTNSNWIKLWLLGYDRINLKKNLLLSDNLKFDQYVSFIIDYLNNIYSKLKPNARVCLIVGDVYEQELIEDVWNNIQQKVSYKFECIYTKKIEQTEKVLYAMNTRKSNATKTEKILVLRKKESE